MSVLSRGLPVALALVIGTGCGLKAAPVAPEQRAPQAVADLRGLARGATVELTWSTPRRRVDKTPLRDADVSRLYRVEDTGIGQPKPALLANGRIVGYTEIATVRLSDPLSPIVRDGRVVYVDRQGLTFGRRYTYVVTTTDVRGRVSPPSSRLTVTFLAAPEPPMLRADAGDRRARLGWEAPARYIDGSPVTMPLLYEVLRGPSAEELAPIARTTPGETSFVDGNLENDRVYTYAVRAIRSEATAMVEGGTSAPVAVTPVDVTPPAPPRDLVAIPTHGEVRLSWQPSPDPDVSQYIVYRAGGARPSERIGRIAARQTTFVDRDVPPGDYRYAVTAQDSGSRANESARSNEVTVTVP